MLQPLEHLCTQGQLCLPLQHLVSKLAGRCNRPAQGGCAGRGGARRRAGRHPVAAGAIYAVACRTTKLYVSCSFARLAAGSGSRAPWPRHACRANRLNPRLHPRSSSPSARFVVLQDLCELLSAAAGRLFPCLSIPPVTRPVYCRGCRTSLRHQHSFQILPPPGGWCSTPRCYLFSRSRGEAQNHVAAARPPPLLLPRAPGGWHLRQPADA